MPIGWETVPVALPTFVIAPDVTGVIVVGVSLGGLVLGGLALRALHRRRTSRASSRRPSTDPFRAPLPAVVANPTKIDDIDGELAWLCRRSTELGWRQPLWFETQPDEPGTAAAREAVSRGARTVLAYGGDGTVRAVAAGLEGSATSLGILPGGTGNLLARNLGLPLTDLNRAVEIGLTGHERRIDLGIVEIDVSGEDQTPIRDVFTVMAGVGFDAEVMARVEPALKEKVGWLAYVMAGARQLRGRNTAITMRLDDGPPVHRRVRSVVVGNCGELTAGLQLLPEAVVDDGWLNVVVVAPRRLVGWATVFVSVLSRTRTGGRHPVVQDFRCRSVEIRADKPLAVQLDGDAVGDARVLRAWLDPLGLIVRGP